MEKPKQPKKEKEFSLLKILSVYQPYFTFSRRDLKQWLIASIMVLGNFLEALSLVLINISFNNFFGVLNLPGLTYTMLFMASLEYIGAVLVMMGIASVAAIAAEFMTFRLNEIMTQDLFSRWMETKTFYGAQFLPKRRASNPANVLSHDLLEANRMTVKFADDFLNVFSFCLVSVVGLWNLSSPLALTIGSMTLMIPGYMAIAAVMFALVNNLIVNKLGNQLYRTNKKQHKNYSQLGAQIHHIETNAEGIELLKANIKEKKNYFDIFKTQSLYKNTLIKIKSGLAFCSALSEEIQYFIGILLAVPQMIAKTITTDTVFIISDYFQRIINFCIWKHKNYDELVALSVYTGEVINLQLDIQDWEAIRDRKQVDYKMKEDIFSIEEVLITDRSSQVILNVNQQEKIIFNDKKITIIQGPSGVGKSTLFRTLAKIWPYVTSGAITLPAAEDDSHIIPQVSCLPKFSTLYEAIIYPKEIELTEEIKAEIKNLLTQLQTAGNKINLLLSSMDEAKDWSNNISGGEKQAVAIVRAIFAKPKFLLMDEPFSSMDSELCAKAEKLLKESLPDTTIVYIDHRQISEDKTKTEMQNPVFDDRYLMKDQKLRMV